MSHTKPITPTSTYWVRATLSGEFGEAVAKARFTAGRNPGVTLCPPEQPGWNFSSEETTEEFAEYAAAWLGSKMPAGCILVTEVVEEN